MRLSAVRFPSVRLAPLRLLAPAAVLLLMVPGFAPQPALPERTTAGAPTAPEAVRAETLRVSVRAGQPLIASLPDRHRGGAATYRALRAPALSWLVDRSFFYQTQPGERGDLPVLFERSVGGAVADTLVLMVSITE